MDLKARHSVHFLYSNYIFNLPTKCTYTIKYMYYYQHSPACFGAYCTSSGRIILVFYNNSSMSAFCWCITDIITRTRIKNSSAQKKKWLI